MDSSPPDGAKLGQTGGDGHGHSVVPDSTACNVEQTDFLPIFRLAEADCDGRTRVAALAGISGIDWWGVFSDSRLKKSLAEPLVGGEAGGCYKPAAVAAGSVKWFSFERKQSQNGV